MSFSFPLLSTGRLICPSTTMVAARLQQARLAYSFQQSIPLSNHYRSVHFSLLDGPKSPTSTHWIYKAPTNLQPYMRLMRADKPAGTWLLYWPCVWSISLASYSNGTLPDPKLLFLFGVGSFLMRGAGCVINDLWDRELDSKVDRTKLRPLASGELSKKQAFGLLSAQLASSFGILCSLNKPSIALGIASIIPVVAYPLMKRITYFPQLVLGMTFNWGALLGWMAVNGNLAVTPVLLYASGIMWTLFYDTLYAYQDRIDDQRVGIKSTAVFFQEAPHLFLTVTALIMVCSLCAIGTQLSMPWTYYALSVGGTAGHLLWQMRNVVFNDPSSCARVFASNRYVGWIVISGIIFSYALGNVSETESIEKKQHVDVRVQ